MNINNGNIGPLDDRCLSEFIKNIHKLTGITISSTRKSMVEGRLRKRVIALGIQSYEDYLKLVQENKNEQSVFVDLITTNETYFFRTPRVWEYIEKKFLPNWIQNHPKQVFMAWSAAASSGEEAHTLGMICQSLKEKNPDFLYQILGTDISQKMVSKCENGEYLNKSIEQFKSLRPDLFQKYMRLNGTSFQVIPEIRSRLRFRQHNLYHRLVPGEKFHLILLRNVLIYFSQPDQEQLLSLLEPNFTENGLLIIGESESITQLKVNYQSIEPLIYQYKPGLKAT